LTTAELVILQLFPQGRKIDFERINTLTGECQEKIGSIEAGYRGCPLL
jgi:hypothetical protein